MTRLEMYRRMLMIRMSEERIEDLFVKGQLRGTTHGSRGQEAVAVGLLSHVDCMSDYITGSHRSHGHYLALNPYPYPFFAELMGKKTGLVEGRGGSQHIAYHNFITNGITGGMVPIAAGLAFMQKIKTKDRVCVSLFGDGATNEGYVMEAMNLASVYELPIIFAMENNNFAMSTPYSFSSKGNMEYRIKGFGIEYHKIVANDVEKVFDFCDELVTVVRKKRKPVFIEFETHRFSGHSKSDKREYIPDELDEYWRRNDPLKLLENKLESNDVQGTYEQVKSLIEDAVRKAAMDKPPKSLRSQ